jgi:hypothetical protein
VAQSLKGAKALHGFAQLLGGHAAQRHVAHAIGRQVVHRRRHRRLAHLRGKHAAEARRKRNRKVAAPAIETRIVSAMHARQHA